MRLVERSFFAGLERHLPAYRRGKLKQTQLIGVHLNGGLRRCLGRLAANGCRNDECGCLLSKALELDRAAQSDQIVVFIRARLMGFELAADLLFARRISDIDRAGHFESTFSAYRSVLEQVFAERVIAGDCQAGLVGPRNRRPQELR